MLDKIVGTVLLLVGIGIGAALAFPDAGREFASTAQPLFQSDRSDYLEPEVRTALQQDLDKQWKQATTGSPLAAMDTALIALIAGVDSLPTKVTNVQLMKLSGKEYTGYAEFNSGDKVKLKVFYDGKQFIYEVI